MTVLIEQKARSLARMGAPNIFARPGWREFYTAVAANPRTRDLVHVSRLDAGSTFTAINLGIVFRDSYYHVLVSHDDGEAARFGPGVAHLRELLRYAIERGLRHFDFTIGDERYKLEWSDHKVPLYDHVAAATMRGAMARPVVVGHRRLKRFIKQNEKLWSAFSRLRAALGSKPMTSAGGGATGIVSKSPPIAPE
jgi:CelD/BcsL family acetyltransferase involved in cellulose biosynthesis